MNSPLEELVEYLRYLRECGERTIELEPGTLEALEAMVAGAHAPAAAQVVSHTGAPVAASPQPAPQFDIAAKTQAPEPVSSGNRQPNAQIGKKCPLMIIGETEAIKAEKYGDLLVKMIEAMGYSLNEVTLTNICGKPRAEKPPTQAEMAAAMPSLRQRVAAAAPDVIVIMGSTAALGILGNGDIAAVHGRWYDFDGIPAMPTFHPAYLTKFTGAKRDAWADLKKVMARLGKMPGAV